MKLRKGAWKLLVLTLVLCASLILVLEVFGNYGYFVIAATGFISLLWLVAHNDKQHKNKYK